MKTPKQTPPNVNDRNARLKAALQANIARRKAQVKGRDTAQEAAGGDTDPGPVPGSGKE